MKNLLYGVIAAFLVIVPPLPAMSQDIQVETIVQALSPENTGPVVSNAGPELTRGIQRHQPIPEVFDLPKMQLLITFEGETHRLTMAGMRALRSVAAAMTDPRLSDASFQIGSHAYLPQNLGASQTLTTRRATAIAEHLNVFYGIPRENLVSVGYGANTPFDMNQPAHPMNQRVELINLSPLDR